MASGDHDDSEADSSMPTPGSDGSQAPRSKDWERDQWAQITAQLGDLSDESGTGPRDYAVAEEPDDTGFIEPDPPMRATDPLPTLAWLFALGGPIVTILFLIVWPSAPSWVYLTAILTSIAGWLVLLWRMPRQRDRDRPDDGAVL